MNKGGVYIFDFDDVLVNTSKLMYSNIRQNWRLYKPYFWDPGELNYECVQNRQLFYMTEWLISDKFCSLKSEEYSGIVLLLWSMLRETFYSTDMYSAGEVSQFAKRTLMNPLFLDSDQVSGVYILKPSATKQQSDSADSFINRYFAHPKIKIIDIADDQKKASVIKEKNIQFDVFIDDEIPAIRSVAETFENALEKREFIIPRYGYNKNIPQELRYLIQEKGGSVTYYDPFKET